MYERFFELRERPFDLSPNPRYLCLTPKHREALSNLEYGISALRGVTLLVGEAGTGKTTLIRAALESDALKGARCVYVNNPALTRQEFVEFLARGFNLSDRAASSKTALLFELEALIKERHAWGTVTALIIDEAQSLPFELLEEVRLLANIETASQKLLQVVLVGQPELADKLNQASLRQFKQRVALRCSLGLLTQAETVTYITKRIAVAGGSVATVFTSEAMERIHRSSRGVPRTISVICDNALVSGFALGQRPIGPDIVAEVCRDFDTDTAAEPLEQEEVAAAPEVRRAPSVPRPSTAAPVPPAPFTPAPAAPRPEAEPASNAAAAGAAGRLFSHVAGRRKRFSFF